MSRSAVNARVKTLKKENETKKAKRKKFIIICVFVLVVIAIAAVTVFLLNQNKTVVIESYSYRGQTVCLLSDGTFNASLAHGVTKKGTYDKITEGGTALVFFNVNGNNEIGIIENSTLYLPKEWDDGHGHGSAFPKEY
ncbi:MAG: hypothetical protein FWC22_03925 [Treponema sp.]|nr:hypothetical protein [Treponema sp.]